MEVNPLFVVIAIGFLASILSELPAWYFCYSKKHFKDLLRDVERKKQQVAQEKAKLESADGKKKSQAKLKAFEEALQTKTQEAASAGMKGQLISSVILTVVSVVLMRRMKNIVVGQLPFKPFWPLNLLTQQGLVDPETPFDVSGVCLFFISMSVMRNIIKHFNPVPQGPSIVDVMKKAQEAQ